MSDTRQLLELRELARQKERELEETKNQLRTVHKKRMDLISQLKRMDEDVKDAIQKRNELNERVKTIKDEVNKILVELEQARREVDGRKAAASKIRGEAKLSEEEARRRLADLEWKLTTEPLSPKIESSIVTEIEHLRSTIFFHEKARKIRETSEDNRQKIFDMREKLNELRSIQRTLRDEANEYHKKFIETKESKKEVSLELDRLKEEELNLGEEKDKLFMELVKCDAQAHLIVSSLRMKREQERYERRKEEGELKAKVANDVAEKIKRGERLSLEELKIYYEVFGGQSLFT